MYVDLRENSVRFLALYMNKKEGDQHEYLDKSEIQTAVDKAIQNNWLIQILTITKKNIVLDFLDRDRNKFDFTASIK